MKHNALFPIVTMVFAVHVFVTAEKVEAVHMANGVKIGEVSSSSVNIWTRLRIKEAGKGDLHKSTESIPLELRAKTE